MPRKENMSNIFKRKNNKKNSKSSSSNHKKEKKNRREKNPYNSHMSSKEDREINTDDSKRKKMIRLSNGRECFKNKDLSSYENKNNSLKINLSLI